MSTADDIRAHAREALCARIDRELSASVLDEAHDVARYAKELHDDTIGPVLFYGSCLRADSPEGIMDVYLLSHSHRAFHSRVHGPGFKAEALSGLNEAIPPNIYFWSIPHAVHEFIYAKVAVVTMDQFKSACRKETFSPSIWARFCQPAALLHADSPAQRRQVVESIADAIETAAYWCAMLGPDTGSARDYWTALFRETYGAELRPERGNRPAIIYDANPERYDALLAEAWTSSGRAFTSQEGHLVPDVDRDEQARARRAFRRRQRGGKGISVARLVKGTLTFHGGIDYLLWKIERHSGTKIELTEFQRRHPVLSAPGVFLRLKRSGAIR